MISRRSLLLAGVSALALPLAGAKAQATIQSSASIFEQLVPFTTERRDVEIYFQSTVTDNAQVSRSKPFDIFQSFVVGKVRSQSSRSSQDKESRQAPSWGKRYDVLTLICRIEKDKMSLSLDKIDQL